MQRTDLIQNNLAFTLHPFLTTAECQERIAWSEAVGYADAPVTTASGPVMIPDYRNNTRVMVDDLPLAEHLWRRFAPRAPPIEGWVACGFNERLRYYRYDPGEFFAPHLDGAFIRSRVEQSFFTLLFYLNEGFAGGDTVLQREVVRPAAGLALCFHHRLIHESTPIVHGRKYVLRSDLMYRRA